MKKFTLLAALASILFSSSLFASDFTEGVHYQKITLKSSRHIEDKVEVAEFYAYGDPASSELEGFLTEWLKTIPENVYFIRRPSVKTQKDWALTLSYTRAEMLGKGDQVHAALFELLNQTPPGLNSMAELVTFNKEQEISGNLPMHILQANFKRLSTEWTDNAFITTTPAIVIDQKYLLTKEMAGSYENLIAIINELTRKAK